MNRPDALSPREADAIEALLDRVHERGWPPLLRATLFGSRARGDAGPDSDLDLLLVCDVEPELRLRAARSIRQLAQRVARRTGVPVAPWTICAGDLEEGRRTPMLVDALAESLPLWPEHAPPLRLAFTPADAVFCAARLLEWVDRGGRKARRALEQGRWSEAAARARDDIARLATASLLLIGDTRHRRAQSLERFERIFVRAGRVSPAVRPALAWAAAAYAPAGDGRPDDAAEARARHGCELAARMEAELVGPILERIAQLIEHAK